MLKFAERLRDMKLITAVLSNTIPPHFNVWQPYVDKFSPIVPSFEARARKPQEKIYELAIRSLRISENEAIYIDDIQEFLEPASRLGLMPIHFKNSEQVQADVLKAII